MANVHTSKSKPQGSKAAEPKNANRDSSVHPLLQLQKKVGNRAVTQLLQNSHAPQGNGPVAQQKRLNSDLKGLGSGFAGQWHDGDPNFHATVYADSNSYNPRGHVFVSDKFVSEFHVTKYSGSKAVLGRRFYDIDSGNKIGKDEKSVDSSFDTLAGKFIQHISGAKVYSDKEAQELHALETLQKQQEEQAKGQKLKEIIATYLSTNEVDVKSPKLALHVGKVKNIISGVLPGYEIKTTVLEDMIKAAKEEATKTVAAPEGDEVKKDV